jgi:hypothetical protein
MVEVRQTENNLSIVGLCDLFTHTGGLLAASMALLLGIADTGRSEDWAQLMPTDLIAQLVAWVLVVYAAFFFHKVDSTGGQHGRIV